LNTIRVYVVDNRSTDSVRAFYGHLKEEIRVMNEYVGITYPKCLRNWLILKLWKRFMCPHHKHLFDEVWSIWGEEDDPQHYLYCDACGMKIKIKEIIPGEKKEL